MFFKKIIFNNIIIKKDFFLKKKNNNLSFFLNYTSFLKFFLNNFIKKGKKIFFFNIFNLIFFDIYIFIKKISKNFKNIKEVQLFSEQNKEIKNINFLLFWIIEDYKYLYFLNVWKPKKAKTKRKKLKQKNKKFDLSHILLKKNKRWKIFFKIFSLKVYNINASCIKLKFLKIFLDLILNVKHSWLYNFKIELYKKILFN